MMNLAEAVKSQELTQAQAAELFGVVFVGLEGGSIRPSCLQIAYRLPTSNHKTPKQKATARVAFLSKSLSRLDNFWWRFTDSNRGPVDYDSIALTD